MAYTRGENISWVHSLRHTRNSSGVGPPHAMRTPPQAYTLTAADIKTIQWRMPHRARVIQHLQNLQQTQHTWHRDRCVRSVCAC